MSLAVQEAIYDLEVGTLTVIQRLMPETGTYHPLPCSCPRRAPCLAVLQRAGILYVAAAGNEATNNDFSPSYPTSYEANNVLSVAASTQDDTLASFSNYGRISVDLAAPGHRILSTVPGNDYRILSGTSMATPLVAGGKLPDAAAPGNA